MVAALSRGCDEATIDEAAMVAACLAALSGDRHLAAALTLRAMAERTATRRRSRGMKAARVWEASAREGVQLTTRPTGTAPDP
jgi:hypothetical protein